MKKIIFTLIVASITFYQLNAQVIEDFENNNILTNIFDSQNDSATITLVSNPDPSGINPGKTVLRYVRKKDYPGWTNLFLPSQPFLYEMGMYIHLRVWKPIISDFDFHLRNKEGYSFPCIPIQPQTIVNGWEEVVFKVENSFVVTSIIFNPDWKDEDRLEDMVSFVDDITINHSPDVGSAPEMVIMDFEHIALNPMLGGAEDKSAIVDFPNPDKSGANLSAQVIKFTREKDGVPWGGFWSTLPEPVDVTENKYMHVKVLKPRISPVKFKIEGGADGNLEIESKYPQTKTNEWEDMVFDLSSKTGTYPTIAFMPDFQDPVSLSDDIVIYFDDIVLNNDPLPRDASEVTFNIDMNNSGLVSGNKVFISGDHEMTDPDGNGVYSITKKLPDGPVYFQFYYTTGTDETVTDIGTSERNFVVSGDTVLNYKWQVGGKIALAEEPKIQVFNVEMKEAGLTTGQKVYISGNFGGIYGNWAEPGKNEKNVMTDSDDDGIYSVVMNLPDGNYQFKFFKGEGWSGSEWPGDPNRSFRLEGSKNIICKWGNPEVKLSVMSCNLITDGNFDTDGPLMGAWYESSSYFLAYNFVKVNNGVLSLSNLNTYEYWAYMATQVLNDYGKMLYKDSVYMLIFDAWAIKDRISTFYIEDCNNGYIRIGTSKDFDAYSGISQWDIGLTTRKTTYIRTFKVNEILPNAQFIFRIAVGAETGTVYVDNVYMLNLSDFKNNGVMVSKIKVTGEGEAKTISTDKGTLQMYASVLPEYSWIKNVEWKVINNTGFAAIDENGLLTAITDGKVTVVAVSLDGTNTSDSLEITISNQEKPGLPIDFENIGDLAWNVFSNGANSYGQLSMAPNPFKSKVNPSEKVLRFVVNKDAGKYAGASSTAFGPYIICKDNIVNMTVRKSVKTTFGIKLEQSTDGGPDTLITVSNSTNDTWVKLKFDFSAVAGHTYQKVTIYPDIRANRTTQSVIYIDDIVFPCTTGISDNKTSTVKIYPNPVKDKLNVVLNQGNTWLIIYNSPGNKISEYYSYENTIQIDVSHYAPGVYILKTGDGSVVKFIK